MAIEHPRAFEQPMLDVFQPEAGEPPRQVGPPAETQGISYDAARDQLDLLASAAVSDAVHTGTRNVARREDNNPKDGLHALSWRSQSRAQQEINRNGLAALRQQLALAKQQRSK